MRSVLGESQKVLGQSSVQTLRQSRGWAGPVTMVCLAPARHPPALDARWCLQVFVAEVVVQRPRVHLAAKGAHTSIAALQTVGQLVLGVIGCLFDVPHTVTCDDRVLLVVHGWNQ